MSKKCKYCFSILNETSTVCDTCKIDANKNKSELTKDEKKVWYIARNLHLIGFLNILEGVWGLLVGLIWPVISSKGEEVGLISLGIAASTAVFGFFLVRYYKWCYFLGIGLYGLKSVLDLLHGAYFYVFINVVFFICIVNPIAKKVFYRKI